MTTPRAAAIYARISSDTEGTGLGVTRQVQDCERLAEQLGWTVAEVYTDNDFSAYSGKKRPAYAQMLDDIRDGIRDAVLVYHVDRLTRRPVELEEFREALDTAGVKHVRFVVGDSDIMTGDGLMVVRFLAAVAANESASKSRRVKRKFQQKAERGEPHAGGPRRPFGYADDKVTVREDEAVVIRTLVARFLAGESLRSLTVWLDQQEVRTVAGGPWKTPTLRTLIASGRIAGLREHQGQVIGPAVWDPIISTDERNRVLARIESRKTSGRRAPRRYLLSGLLRCGKCGNRLYSAARATTRRYVCNSGPDHGGCGRLTVVAEPVEQMIADAVLMRLSSPALSEALAGRAAADEQASSLADQVDSDREQLDELAGLYGRKAINAAEWLAARNPIEARLREGQRRLNRMTASTALDGLTGLDGDLGPKWAGLNLDRQHAVISALLEHAVVGPGTPGARGLDPSRVQPVWRL
ncbi:recombinase family protein [Phycicoccus sp. Soil802]|uniref:recombinase family protein n=1 Tax=Phycicoccus sp. Soil802 TaxID=1736414 RepID=UPI0009ECC1AE|nr:recombinase family protein [Phycicoccus sp. Soil802]